MASTQSVHFSENYKESLELRAERNFLAGRQAFSGDRSPAFRSKQRARMTPWCQSSSAPDPGRYDVERSVSAFGYVRTDYKQMKREKMAEGDIYRELESIVSPRGSAAFRSKTPRFRQKPTLGDSFLNHHLKTHKENWQKGPRVGEYLRTQGARTIPTTPSDPRKGEVPTPGPDLYSNEYNAMFSLKKGARMGKRPPSSFVVRTRTPGPSDYDIKAAENAVRPVTPSAVVKPLKVQGLIVYTPQAPVECSRIRAAKVLEAMESGSMSPEMYQLLHSVQHTTEAMDLEISLEEMKVFDAMYVNMVEVVGERKSKSWREDVLLQYVIDRLKLVHNERNRKIDSLIALAVKRGGRLPQGLFHRTLQTTASADVESEDSSTESAAMPPASTSVSRQISSVSRGKHGKVTAHSDLTQGLHIPQGLSMTITVSVDESATPRALPEASATPRTG